jgi:hypothetical protein
MSGGGTRTHYSMTLHRSLGVTGEVASRVCHPELVPMTSNFLVQSE